MASALRLRTLGGLAVERNPPLGPGAAAQRRPLALLALLAAASERGVSRDKLLACLWPESSQEKARHLLTQTLYALRRDLHAQGLFLGSNELKLNPRVLSTDVQEFEAALTQGELERAVALYHGPFLDGFFLSGAPEFERWTDGERARLAQCLGRACEALATAATARGDHPAAVEWCRRLTALDPLNSRYALGLVKALAATGDRAGALRYARTHADLLRTELGAAPDEAFTATVGELRAQTTGPVPRAAAGSHLQRVGAALAQQYTIERELGRGGTTTVYLARDLKHNRAVVLKVLHPELSSAVAAERFLRQIRLVAQLRHPHILPLYDSGEADGFFYYIAPYVEGGSLRARLEREPRLPLYEALQIGREVADALDYAHRHDVLHRNVKPENVLLDAGQAVVAGFGIVRALHVARQDRLTAEGLRMGTPAYMSPEQAMCASDLDGRSDIYTLACVVFEMLAGAPPFTGRDTETMLAQRVTASPPRIRRLRPDVPAAVDAALLKALATSPAARFQTAGEFAQALAVS